MKKNIGAFVLGSENRKKIVQTLLEYPDRQWSCTSMEQTAKLSHATVFRTLNGLVTFGLLKTTKINKRDILYEFCKKSPVVKELMSILNSQQNSLRETIHDFIEKIKKKNVLSIVLYGSVVKKVIVPESDIDLLIILKKADPVLEQKTLADASKYSADINKTISPTIITVSEFSKEKNGQFFQSVKQAMEVLYGKNPF